MNKTGKKILFYLISVLLPLFTVFLIMFNYGRVKEYVTENYENPCESTEFAEELLHGNFLLYKNLQEKVTGESVTYAELYLKDMRALLEIEAEDYSEEELEHCKDNFNKIMSGELSGFLSDFSELDYYAEDLETGIHLSNTLSGKTLDASEYTFYLEIVYDENGSAMIEDAKSQNTARLMKNVATFTLTKNQLLQNWIGIRYSFRGDGEPMNLLQYGSGPKNCRIVYGIANPEGTFLTEGPQNYWSERNIYYTYKDSGIMGYIAFACFALLFSALFLPLNRLREKPFCESRCFNLPLELLIAAACLLAGFSSVLLESSIRYMDGNAGFTTHVLLLFVFFFTAWYLGLSLRTVREKGIRRYIKENSLIYRIFPFCKKKIKKLFDSLEHIDVTQKAGKTILKVVLINAAILFIISCMWFGGLMVTLVYSVVLYFGLKFYVSRMQKKYSVLLQKIKEISSGNLNVEIKEDLGIFEPFKEQLLQIQTGFRNAVEEEVKSQKMKSELITNVSHDLKTPLTAIITYVDLLKDEKLSDEQRKDCLNTLEKKSLRLKVLIEDLFEVSKATSGNITFNYMDVDICNLIKQVALEMSDKLNAAGLDVRMNLPEEKIIVSLDSQKTYRIYENLFQNIAKYSLQGTRVYIQGTLTEDGILISMKNISATELSDDTSHLTERFVRGDASRNTEGSGLGLAIVKSFVELQGGKFVLENDGDLFKAVTFFPVKR